MSVLDWSILTVAASSLVFAVIAYRQVMATTKVVRAGMTRFMEYMDKLPDDPLNILDSEFLGDVVVRLLTRGQRHPDGSSVSIHEIMEGYIETYGPRVAVRIENLLPEVISTVLNGTDKPDATPDNNPGRALAAKRWGNGLKGAQAVTKVAKVVGMDNVGEKLSQVVEIGKAAKEAIPLFKEIRAEIAAIRGPKKSKGVDAPRGQSDWEAPA